MQIESGASRKIIPQQFLLICKLKFYAVFLKCTNQHSRNLVWRGRWSFSGNFSLFHEKIKKNEKSVKCDKIVPNYC